MGYSLCMMADFQNGLISRIFKLEQFFAQNHSKFSRMDFDMFLAILVLDLKFCMGYSLCMIFGIAQRFFTQNNCKLFL